jgi:hypothetical protein
LARHWQPATIAQRRAAVDRGRPLPRLKGAVGKLRQINGKRL